jgi:hypothetical protein
LKIENPEKKCGSNFFKYEMNKSYKIQTILKINGMTISSPLHEFDLLKPGRPQSIRTLSPTPHFKHIGCPRRQSALLKNFTIRLSGPVLAIFPWKFRCCEVRGRSHKTGVAKRAICLSLHKTRDTANRVNREVSNSSI